MLHRRGANGKTTVCNIQTNGVKLTNDGVKSWKELLFLWNYGGIFLSGGLTVRKNALKYQVGGV
jgi:hypothetical protein